MDDAICLMFLALIIVVVAEIVIETRVMCVVKGLIIYKGVVDSETRNDLIKVFYGQD